MRILHRAAASLALLVVAGCASGNSIDDYAGGVSSETTASVVAPATPRVAVGEAVSAVGYAESEAGSQGAQVLAMAAAPRPEPPSRSATRVPVYKARFGDAHPIDFGRAQPQHHVVHGVDVSRWQGEIDWATLRDQGANFAFIKATDGGDHLDPMFLKNWNAAHQAGVKRGAYHFFYWCRRASEQADWFIRNVPKVQGALPPVIDVEWNHQSSCKRRPSRADVLEKMQVFMDRLERHYGQRPIIYTAPDFYEDNLQGAFPNHPFWLRAVAEHPSKVYPNRANWVFWQYSGTGQSKGVKGDLDLNVFRGSLDEWRRWLAQVGG